jgi:hypothetical protein
LVAHALAPVAHSFPSGSQLTGSGHGGCIDRADWSNRGGGAGGGQSSDLTTRPATFEALLPALHANRWIAYDEGRLN